MSTVSMFDNSMSLSEVALRHPESIPVRCVSADGKAKSGVFALLMQKDAQVSALTVALQEFLCTPKPVHVLLDGAAPSSNTELRDLVSVDGGISLTYSTEGVFGGTVAVTPCGGGGSW